MAAELSMRRMVTKILDAQLEGVPEQQKAEQVRHLHAAIHKQIDNLRGIPYERRLVPLIRMFDDVKPVARQLLWEELLSQAFSNIHDMPSTQEVSRKKVEEGRKDNQGPKAGICRTEGVCEIGSCV
jgi:hypothetical protein